MLEKFENQLNAELLKELDAVRKKILLIEPISQEIKTKFHEVLESLVALKDEILNKQKEALRRNALIKEKVDLLVLSGKVQVNEEEYQNSEISVKQYATLLQNIIGDIEQELSSSSALISDQVPSHLIVFKYESDSFSEYMQEKIKALKKYIKKIHKDLTISDSRYHFGFDAQMKRITYFEHFVAFEKREEKK